MTYTSSLLRSVRRLWAGPLLLLPLSAAPDGDRWRLTYHETDGTDLVIDFTLAVRGSAWEMYSRPGAVKEMIPWYQQIAGRILGKLPPHGALIAARGSATSTGGIVSLTGTIDSPLFGKRAVTGSIRGGVLHADLRWLTDSVRVVGTLDGTPTHSGAPVRNYRSIARETMRMMRNFVYDPDAGRTDAFARFERALTHGAERAVDDLDLVTTFNANRGHLPSSHYGFIRNPRIATQPLDSVLAGDASVDPESHVRLQFYGNGVVFLQVRRWDRVGPAIDRAFARIDSSRAAVLMLDVRGNPGGDATSLLTAAHLFRDTTQLGVVLGRKWYDSHRRPPNAKESEVFPLLPTSGDPIDLIRFVREYGGARATLIPRAPIFTGRVLVLANGGSGSASEPLVHLLKSSRRATVIGERTAGAMLTALPHPTGEGFIVTVPEADYFAADGTRLEGNGVRPDIEARGGDVLIKAGELARETHPYGGWVWLGYSYGTLQRRSDALDAWRHALPLAPTDRTRGFVQAKIDSLEKGSRQ